MDDLPTQFDAIVIGTGLIEAIVAAALSRIGKSVLHIDANDYYGEAWASFTLESIEHWIANNSCGLTHAGVEQQCNTSLTSDRECLIKIKKIARFKNIERGLYTCRPELSEVNIDQVSSDAVSGTTDLHTDNNGNNFSKSKWPVVPQIRELSRRFNLDLCPKLLYSKGMMVELLISSNVAKYAEFKSLTRVLTWRENHLEPVPCSRADVFSTKNVSVVQKRLLIKMLMLFADYTNNLGDFKSFEKKTFLAYLEHKKLPENLIHYILYAIAMGDETTPCLEGVKACKAFLESLGRYGNTPFIFPMYGCGELPQCFSRFCAVFGGIYCLNRGVDALISKDDRCVGIISGGTRIDSEKIIISSGYLVEKHSTVDNSNVSSRGIFITERSILKSEKDTATLLQYPSVPLTSNHPVTVIELGSGTCTCPDNYYVVHMTAKSTGTKASSDLRHVVESLFETGGANNDGQFSKPRILWSLTWNSTNGTHLPDDCPLKNVKVCRGTDAELDYELAILEARKIFNELYPDEEFLPRAPDPDEIIVESEQKSESQTLAGDPCDSSVSGTE